MKLINFFFFLAFHRTVLNKSESRHIKKKEFSIDARKRIRLKPVLSLIFCWQRDTKREIDGHRVRKVRGAHGVNPSNARTAH